MNTDNTSTHMDQFKALNDDEYDANAFSYMLGCALKEEGGGVWTMTTVINERANNHRIDSRLRADFLNGKCTVYLALGTKFVTWDNKWILVLKHRDVYYAFDAWCDSTGFDCQGGGRISTSKSSTNFYHLGLTDQMRAALHKGIKGDDAKYFFYDELELEIPKPKID